MILLFVVWIITFMLVIPYGFAISKLLHSLVKDKNNIGIIECFFLGIVGITSLSCCINYFYPINKIVLGVFFVGGMSIFLSYWKDITSLLKSQTTKFLFHLTFVQLLILIFSLLGICLYSLSTPVSYDMDLYHLQYMQWISEYKIIPGLGNLHGRFAFNSNFLLLSSLFYNLKSSFYIFPLNGLIAIVVLGSILKNWNQRTSSFNLVYVLIYVLYLVLFGQVISSTSTDFSVNLIVLYLFLYVYDTKDKIGFYNISYVFILSLFCVTLKISCVIILLLPVYLLLRYRKTSLSSKNIGILLLIGIFILAPWLGRYIVLSGYLIYPFDKIDIFSFDWKMPIDLVKTEMIDAYGWARIPFQDVNTTIKMPLQSWLPIWFTHLGLFTKFTFLLAFLSPIWILVLVVSKRISQFSLTIWIIGILGTLYLIFTAPDLRFASGFILVTGFLPLWVMMQNSSLLKKIISPMISLGIVILLFFLSHIALGQIKLYQLNNTYTHLLLTPQPYGIRNTEESFQTMDEQIYFPTLSNKCYDHYLPCSPYPNPNLHFRGDKIEDGFIIKQE